MDAQGVYRELNKIYSSDHNDNASEMNNAQLELTYALQDGVTPDTLLTKMRELKAKIERSGEYKTKLSTVILNRFWEKTFVEQIPYRPFKMEQ